MGVEGQTLGQKQCLKNAQAAQEQRRSGKSLVAPCRQLV